MSDLIVRQVDRGFDAKFDDASELKPGSAADGSQNVLYSRGLIKTPYGFDQVSSGSLPLSGGEILSVFMFPELDLTEHMMAVTPTKVYRRNTLPLQWNDVTQSGASLGANYYNPISFAVIAHTDGLALNGTGDNWYNHLVLCPGKNSPIQRWAGQYETDFADLVGADGYHTVGSGVTTHYAAQVGSFMNRLLLISPSESDAVGSLTQNHQRIRWPQIAKLESWTGTGSGATDLIDTGDSNVWGAKLGHQWIQYQKRSIWSLNHIGGDRVFDPRIETEGVGLLAARLLYARDKYHYFVGSDYNIYEFTGGSERRNIGRNIDKYLQRDLDPTYARRCWLTMGAQNSRLWLYIVPNGETYATEAYGIDVHTGAWMKRDLTHKWATGGVTSVSLLGRTSYVIGDTYAEKLLEKSPAKNVAVGGAVRSSNVVTVTTDVDHSFLATESVILTGVDSGGEANAFSGTHTIASVPTTKTFTFAQTGADESNLAAGTARVDKPPTSRDYINYATTSRQAITEVLSEEVITLGDNSGYVYQFSSSATQDDSVDIPSRHITEIVDAGDPANNKLWPGITVSAKGTSLTISYRTGNFQTTGTGWIELTTLDLTTEFEDYFVPVHDTAKRIQFKLSSDGDDWQVSNYIISQPVLEGVI